MSPTPKIELDPQAHIVLKRPDNPKREDAKNHERYATMMRLVQRGRNTVADVLASGVTRGDLRYDVTKGFIEIVKEVPTAPTRRRLAKTRTRRPAAKQRSAA
jgi:hypothetical protein